MAAERGGRKRPTHSNWFRMIWAVCCVAVVKIGTVKSLAEIPSDELPYSAVSFKWQDCARKETR